MSHPPTNSSAYPVVGKILGSVAAALIPWALLYPYPTWLLVGLLIAMPWIAIGLIWQSKGVFSVEFDPNVAQVKGTLNLWLLILLPGLPLLIVESTVHGIPTWPMDGNWSQLLILSLIGGLLMTALVSIVSSSTEGMKLRRIGSFLTMSLYALGTIIMANGVLDKASPKTFNVLITNKDSTVRSWGKGGRGPLYDFTFRGVSNSNYNGPVSSFVPYSLYSHKNTGDTVCVQIHPGALSMRWMSLDECSAPMEGPP
jgi:hypothetical protein